VSGHRELTPADAAIQPGKARADEPFPVVGRMKGQAAATGERIARAAAAMTRWQLTFMIVTVPATRPDCTTI
jgi:hypothetical protein